MTALSRRSMFRSLAAAFVGSAVARWMPHAEAGVAKPTSLDAAMAYMAKRERSIRDSIANSRPPRAACAIDDLDEFFDSIEKALRRPSDIAPIRSVSLEEFSKMPEFRHDLPCPFLTRPKCFECLVKVETGTG